jgi:hypothetical protein
MCSPNTLKRRFGGYREIYETIGYRPLFRDYYRGPRAESAMCVRRDLVERISTLFPKHVVVKQQRMRTKSILWVDHEFYVAVLLGRWVEASRTERAHWVVCPNPSEYDYITLFCRLNTANNGILSFHLFPRMNLIFRRCHEDDRWLATGTRLNDLNEFYNVVKATRRTAA